MTFQIGDKVRLNTKSPFYGCAYEKTLSEVGTIVDHLIADEWSIDFPSHKGFKVFDSEIELVEKATTLKAPLHPKSVKLRIIKGIPPDSPIKQDSAPAIQPPDISTKTDEIIRQWKLDKSLKLETLAADFYTLIDLQCDFPKEPKINKPLKRLTTQLADQFSAYLDMVIGGEVRHATEHAISGYDDYEEENECYPSVNDMPLSQPAKDILYALQKHHGSCGRDDAWGQWKEIRAKFGIKALQVAREIFHLDWEDGYGGDSWARATAILMDYLNSTLTATAFVDTCFGLHHNNNIILDKVWKVGIDLKGVLDSNLKNRMLDVSSYCSPEVKELVRRFR